MKTLYLLRHSKAASDMNGITDFDRPLTERGYGDAHLVSRFLADKNTKVDAVLSSPAIRAISTALIFSMQLKFPVEQIQIRKNLYDSTVKNYLQCISDVEMGESLLVAGHNETISEVALKLSKQRILELKTSAVAVIEFDINSWKEILTVKGDLVFVVDPGTVGGL